MITRLVLAAVFVLPACIIQGSVVFTTLYSFRGFPDGSSPYCGLVQGSDGYFYGTTENGGANGYGTVFKISTNGALTTLYSFTAGNDGAYPEAGLLQGSNGYFYGTTSSSGGGFGCAFKISTNGTLTNLCPFIGTNNGAYPTAGLVQGADGHFYGTTTEGGTNNPDGGTVFKISTNGTLTTLYSFAIHDGEDPAAGLVQGSDGNFYGTTAYGGTNGLGSGTVFKISANGALTSLYSFSGNDGSGPSAALVQGSDGNFYGTTDLGGTNGGYGTVFKISTNGTLTSLYSFAFGKNGFFPSTAGLVQGSDGNFYGTTFEGGSYTSNPNGYGTVFKISTNGTLTSLYSFNGGREGANPYGGLVQGSDGSFYGTTYTGGTNSPNGGTVFRISVGLVIASRGSLKVTIMPSGAASAGAQWQVDGGTNQNSGVTLTNLSAGNHIVSFTSISGWIAPSNQTVTITNGATNAVIGLYAPVPAQPGIASVSLSGTNLVLNASNGTSGATYLVLASTNLGLPLSQWTPVATNILSANGNFSITATNTVTPNFPRRFYILEAP